MCKNYEMKILEFIKIDCFKWRNCLGYEIVFEIFIKKQEKYKYRSYQKGYGRELICILKEKKIKIKRKIKVIIENIFEYF